MKPTTAALVDLAAGALSSPCCCCCLSFVEAFRRRYVPSTMAVTNNGLPVVGLTWQWYRTILYCEMCSVGECWGTLAFLVGGPFQNLPHRR